MSEACNIVAIWPGFEAVFENEGRWVEAGMPERDPDWKFVDAAGHGHFYAADGSLPTLKWNQQSCTMGHGEDCDAEGTWHCGLCGEEIQPGTRPAKPIYVAGRSRITCTVQYGHTSTVYAVPKEAWTAFMNRGTESLLRLASELWGEFAVEHRLEVTR